MKDILKGPNWPCIEKITLASSDNKEKLNLNIPGILNSKPRLLNLILLNLIVRFPTERSHYINNLWNATFGLWKIRIMNGWMVSF